MTLLLVPVAGAFVLPSNVRTSALMHTRHSLLVMRQALPTRQSAAKELVDALQKFEAGKRGQTHAQDVTVASACAAITFLLASAFHSVPSDPAPNTSDPGHPITLAVEARRAERVQTQQQPGQKEQQGQLRQSLAVSPSMKQDGPSQTFISATGAPPPPLSTAVGAAVESSALQSRPPDAPPPRAGVASFIGAVATTATIAAGQVLLAHGYRAEARRYRAQAEQRVREVGALRTRLDAEVQRASEAERGLHDFAEALAAQAAGKERMWAARAKALQDELAAERAAKEGQLASLLRALEESRVEAITSQRAAIDAVSLAEGLAHSLELDAEPAEHGGRAEAA